MATGRTQLGSSLPLEEWELGAALGLQGIIVQGSSMAEASAVGRPRRATQSRENSHRAKVGWLGDMLGL